MLKADIALPDLVHAPVWTGSCIAFATSRITPHAHPLLETLLVRTEGRWFAIVRERHASSAGAACAPCRDVDGESFNRLYRECMQWPLDYVIVEAARAGCRMKVRAGAHGSVPVYCRTFDDRVIVSWDVDDLLTGPIAIDPEIAGHRLALRPVYSARQLCVGITLLTERATLHVEPGQAVYRYPPAVEPTVAAPERDERTVLAEFGERLHAIVTARPAPAERVIVELSGGMDSAAVASALAAARGPVASGGILLDGATRDPQVRRRQCIVDRLGLSDGSVDMRAYPPRLDLTPHPGKLRRLYWEYYLEACEAWWMSARSRGHDLLFSGIGGDELFPLYADEIQQAHGGTTGRDGRIGRYAEQMMTARTRQTVRCLRAWDAPAGPVPATALLAHACRAPDLLTHGLWPVHPLSDPGLVAFCHRLPAASRRGRAVEARYLAAHLGDDVFPPDYAKESFEYVLPEIVARHAGEIAAQLRECALADLGIVDRGGVLALLETVATTRAHEPMAPLASFLWLERLARQVG